MRVTATIEAAKKEHHSQATDFANPDAYAATSIAATKTVYAEQDVFITTFSFDTAKDDVSRKISSTSKELYLACKGFIGTSCELDLDDSGKVKGVLVNEKYVSAVSHKSRNIWYVLAVIFVIIAVLGLAYFFLS